MTGRTRYGVPTWPRPTSCSARLQGPQHRGFSHRRGPDPGRSTPSSPIWPLLSASEIVGRAAQARRHRGLRIHCLPRCDRRGMCAGPGRHFPVCARRATSSSAIRRSASIPATRSIRLQRSQGRLRAGRRDARARRAGLRVGRAAGVHRAPSIKVAEAAKVIENTQRDLNIAS